MEKLSYSNLTENLIEIAWVFQNCVKKYPQLTDIDSITWKQEFVAWANEFEVLYPDPEYWDDADYVDTIDALTQKKIFDFAGITISFEEEVAQLDAVRKAYHVQVMAKLTADQLRIVNAMETAGWLFQPTEIRPIWFGDATGFPIVFNDWKAAYEFIDSAQLKDAPGLREKVQKILHPEK